MGMNTFIYKNANGDSRTAPKDVSFEDFQKANDMHIQDVRNVINNLAYDLMFRGQMHDFTKKSLEELFYDNFKDAITNKTDFVSNDWYKEHIQSERHHLSSRCPSDVNLIDVLEMIVDCVCAGKARSGEIRGLEINEEILRNALENTVKQVSEMVDVNQ